MDFLGRPYKRVVITELNHQSIGIAKTHYININLRGGKLQGMYLSAHLVKPAFRGHPRDQEKCPLNGGVPLLEVTSTKIKATF